MMQKKVMLFLCILLITLVFPLPVSANAAEPPCFTILVNGAPEDMTLTMILPSGTSLSLLPLRRGWETYFRFFYHDLPAEPGYESVDEQSLIADSLLQISVPSADLFYTMDPPSNLYKTYNNIAVLNLTDGTYDSPCLPLRSGLLVAGRVLITLIVEGAILWILGYRNRRSWLVFLVVNLITQSLLNVSLTGHIPPDSYWGFSYYTGEILIFIAEALVYAAFFREYTKKRAVCTAVLANAASLVTGVLLLSYLPM